MRPRVFTLGKVWLAFFVGVLPMLGHDLTTSYATIRCTSDSVELQIKIAAEAVWPAVQNTVAPGAVFTLEEFETVGKAQLLAFGRTMEEVSAGGAIIPPREINVAVVEDNFVFTFTYPRPARDALQLTEKYLKLMPADYASRVVVLDQSAKPLASKTLHLPNLTFAFTLPASAPPSTAVPPRTR